jgi:hypothetical protein
MAIKNGETWFIAKSKVELNYHFIALVMGAYCSLPIADYKLCNNGERGQPHAVLMSHLTVVALLAYKASMKSFAKPKQNHSVNILQYPQLILSWDDQSPDVRQPFSSGPGVGYSIVL